MHASMPDLSTASSHLRHSLLATAHFHNTASTHLGQDEVREYAKWLGMDLVEDEEMFWIAKEGLKAPLPENWKPCKTVDTDEIYYFNFATGAGAMCIDLV